MKHSIELRDSVIKAILQVDKDASWEEKYGCFYKSPEWRELRYEALKRYGRRCICCGATPEGGAVMHVDHIKPRSTHPELELEIKNLQILCEDCNIGKSNLDEINWKHVDPDEDMVVKDLLQDILDWGLAEHDGTFVQSTRKKELHARMEVIIGVPLDPEEW